MLFPRGMSFLSRIFFLREIPFRREAPFPRAAAAGLAESMAWPMVDRHLRATGRYLYDDAGRMLFPRQIFLPRKMPSPREMSFRREMAVSRSISFLPEMPFSRQIFFSPQMAREPSTCLTSHLPSLI